MERLPHFTKHYMAEAYFAVLLVSSGLIIPDVAKAARYMESIGTYPLSAYMHLLIEPKRIACHSCTKVHDSSTYCYLGLFNLVE